MTILIQKWNVLGASADDVLQDNLSVGYEAKSNDILKKLDGLNNTQRRQALVIFENVIHTLKEN